MCYFITYSYVIVESVNNFCDGKHVLFYKLTAMSLLSLLTTSVMVNMCYFLNLRAKSLLSLLTTSVMEDMCYFLNLQPRCIIW